MQIVYFNNAHTEEIVQLRKLYSNIRTNKSPIVTMVRKRCSDLRLCIGGWVDDANWETVSVRAVRAYICARGLVVK